MSIANRRTPERNNPLFSGAVLDAVSPLNTQLTTAGGARTITPAELLGGLLTLDVEDAQTITFPTAALLNAAIPGVQPYVAGAQAGTRVVVDVINFGDATLTCAEGSGMTLKSIGGLDAVMTIVAAASKRFIFVCTGVKNDHVAGSSDSWDVYGLGSIGTAVS